MNLCQVLNLNIQRWKKGQKGATLRKYFPTVQARLKTKWILPDYWISQFLTWNWGFWAKLHGFEKNFDPLFPIFGIPEIAEHIMY